MTRRDRCYAMAKRAQLLKASQAAAAWYHLSGALEDMGLYQIPKFNDLASAVRRATIFAANNKSSVHDIL